MRPDLTGQRVLPHSATDCGLKQRCRCPNPDRYDPRQYSRSGHPMLLAATADSSGGGGDYGATSLSPTATWEAGGSTGDFTWNYSLRVPPATAGPAPNLSISYNSASVDGRTAGENNQTSVIGEGFSITESYIERKYAACKDDGQTGKGDLCWKYANATLVLNGKAVELVNTCTDKAACDSAALSQAAGRHVEAQERRRHPRRAPDRSHRQRRRQHRILESHRRLRQPVLLRQTPHARVEQQRHHQHH